jgi:hypothetical protein
MLLFVALSEKSLLTIDKFKHTTWVRSEQGEVLPLLTKKKENGEDDGAAMPLVLGAGSTIIIPQTTAQE